MAVTIIVERARIEGSVVILEDFDNRIAEVSRQVAQAVEDTLFFGDIQTLPAHIWTNDWLRRVKQMVAPEMLIKKQREYGSPCPACQSPSTQPVGDYFCCLDCNWDNLPESARWGQK